MYSRGIVLILALALCLGLFFQYNRNDGFLMLYKNVNTAVPVTHVQTERPQASIDVPKEQYTVVYRASDHDSVKLKNNIVQTLSYLKKEVLLQEAEAEFIPAAAISGVIIATDDWDRVTSMSAIRAYVQQGGKVYIAVTPKTSAAFYDMAGEIGFDTVDDLVVTPGCKMLSNLLIGGQGAELDEVTCKNTAITGTLVDHVHVYMQSLEQVPLLWDCDYGQGKYVVYNGSNMQEKEQRGVLTSMLGIGQSVYLYPVVGIKTVCIDDFPSPIPEGYNEHIANEYRMSMPEFFRQVWWPDMVSAAQRYNVKYTGLIIETYNEKVDPPFAPEENNTTNRNNLIIYGRELLKIGGELGVHGYNHQSLAPVGYVKHEAYVPWKSQEDMEQSLQEVNRYVHTAYPDYQLKVYVPPSNILSPQGRAAVVQSLPDLNIIASIAIGDPDSDDSYLQEYAQAPDGILEMPRLSSDYSRHLAEDWSILNGITYLGIFSHFVHPDNIFYQENADKTWREMFDGFESLLKMIQEKFGWLRSCTMSQGGHYVKNFLTTDYRVVNEDDVTHIYSWGYQSEAYFILRSPRKITAASGCQIEMLDKQVYLIKIHQPEVQISWDNEGLS